MADADDLIPLLEGVQRRDESAARRLVARLHPLVARIVGAHRPWRVAHEDLVQEVFMSVFADIGSYRGASPFVNWVARIAVTTCLDALRREKVRPELRWADLSEQEVAALEAMRDTMQETQGADRAHAREVVSKLLEMLPAEDRVLIQWLALEEKSVEEVCALTGWGRSRVKVRAFRARKHMRHALEKLLQETKP
jgi:RNA polymerase sigma-70 factor (ECF subfamily)